MVDNFNILGITFKRRITEKEQFKLNFEQELIKCKHTCNTWVNRNLSLKGKITVINSFMLSLLQYPCSMMFIPVRVIFDFKKIIVSFISNSRKNKVVYGLLIQDIEAGDLCLPDLETRLQNLKRD